ncbi:MAG: hypothetical protein WC661_19770 [Opitutaceae bacterium]|jgi:hypothetical protein
MKPPRLPLLIVALAGIGGLWLFLYPRVVSEPTAAEKHALDSPRDRSPSATLARILAEPDEVRRLHLLSAWLEAHTLEEIGPVLASIPEEARNAVNELVTLKLYDLSATLSKSELLQREFAYISSLNPRPPLPPTLHDSLLSQAATDPVAAFRRTIKTHMSPEDRENTLRDILGLLATKDPAQALALLATTHALNQNHARQCIAENWTLTDPKAAFAWALSQPPAPAQTLISAVLFKWGERDPEAALEAVTALPSNPADNYVTGWLLTKWLRLSPGESAAWIKAQPNPDPVLMDAAIKALGATQPAVAVQLLEKTMSDEARLVRTKTLTEIWSRSDPLAAAQWLQMRPKDSTYLAAAECVVGPLAAKDPAAALAFYRTLPADTNLGAIVSQLASGLDRTQALDWLLALPSSANTARALEATLDRMSFSTPAQFLALLGRIPPGPQQDPVYIAATRNQISFDPAGMSAWLGKLPTAETRDSVLRAVAVDWAKARPAEAADYARNLPAGPMLDTLVRPVLSELLARDPAAAADWALKLPDGKVVRAEIARSFAALAEHAPEAALQRLGALPAGPVRTATLGGLVDGLAKTRPEEAAHTLTTIGSPSEQLALVGQLANRWGYNEPAAATVWVKTLPPGEIRDQGLAKLSGTIVRSDPAAPLALLSLASSGETRYLLARESLLAIQTRDESAARTALSQLSLPPADMARLKDQLDSSR